MVVDTSVLVAVVRHEPDADQWDETLAKYARLKLSAANYVETVMVLAGRNSNPDLHGFDFYLERMNIEIEEVSEPIAKLARKAFLRYGKGRDPARLNYGDCFSYALAVYLDEPLLYKGNDFTLTDVPRM